MGGTATEINVKSINGSIEGGRQRELFITSCRVEIRKVLQIGYQERKLLSPRSEVVEASVVRASTAP